MPQSISVEHETSEPGPEIEACHQLSKLVADYTKSKGDGQHATVLEQLAFLRESAVGTTFRAVYKPTLVLVLQGEKVATLGVDRYLYSPAKFLVVTVDLPIAGVIIKTSPGKPYLAIELRLDLTQLADIFVQTRANYPKPEGSISGLSVNNAGLPLIRPIAKVVS